MLKDKITDISKNEKLFNLIFKDVQKTGKALQYFRRYINVYPKLEKLTNILVVEDGQKASTSFKSLFREYIGIDNIETVEWYKTFGVLPSKRVFDAMEEVCSNHITSNLHDESVMKKDITDLQAQNYELKHQNEEILELLKKQEEMLSLMKLHLLIK